MPGADPRDRLPRVLSLRDASLLIVASVVGSGIFFTPGPVAALLPSAGWILLAWLAGALISLVGALVNAELGTMYPRAGGDYVYLREGIHPAAGFMVGWLSFFAIYAGTIAALAVLVGEMSAAALGVGPGGGRVIAGLAIAGASLVNLRGTRLGAQLNNVTTLAKVAALLAFLVLSGLIGEGSFAPWRAASDAVGAVGNGPEGVSDLALRFARALSPILFSYLGWNASVYVASEIQNPSRNLPRSLFLGLGVCTALYLGINVVYFYALGPHELAAATDAGAASAVVLFGPIGGGWVSAFVFLSVLGTLNATVLVGPRIVYAMALDGLFARSAEQIHPRFETPNGAIAVQAMVATVLVFVLESFPSALDFTVFGIVLATSADTVALFRLRRREPARARPYQAWGYPWLPAAYLLVNLLIGLAIVVGRPREAAITLSVLLTGALLYRVIAPQTPDLEA